MLARALLTAAATVSLAGCATYGDDMAMSDDTITETVVMSPDHETLETLVVSAGLADTLSGAGPFTVFAPTDAAFDRLPEAVRTAAMQPENRDMLRGVLTYHVVAGDVKAAALTDMISDGGGTATLTTVQGTTLRASIENGSVKLTDAMGGSAFVETADIDASNGTIHSINGVLMPRM